MYGQPGPGLRINKQLEVALPESLTQIQMEWVTLDADTLIDLVVVGVASDGTVRVMTFGNKVTALEWQKTQVTQLLSAYVQPADLDGDNQIDLLISGKAQSHNSGLFFFKSNGDFTFTVSKIIDRASPFRVADFTNDAIYIYPIKDTDDWRINNIAAITSAITQHVALKLSYTVEHRNVAVFLRNKDDTFTTASIVVKL
jgi:hypothetical protein